MKTLKILFVLSIVFLNSCATVSVNADYDKKANFTNYKTYAYSKTGIDKAEISDLDKKRILYAIDEVMPTKGFTKSDAPDVLVSIFTKEREVTNVYNRGGFGYGGFGFGGFGGFGFSPFWGGGMMTSSYPEGTLFIDIVDAKSNELVWQGAGTGYLTSNTNKKDERFKTFVTTIMSQYPPVIK